MNPESARAIKYVVGGMALGALLAVGIGLREGYLLTPSDSERIGERKVVAAEGRICSNQFTQDPHYQENLKQFQGLDFTKREEFIQKGGWNKMPGDEKSGDDVTRACSDRLTTLLDKESQ